MQFYNDNFNNEDEKHDELVNKFLNSYKSGTLNYFEPEELETICNELIMQNDFKMAKVAIDYGLSIYPDNSALLLTQIDYYFNKKLFDTAENLAKKYINENPDDLEGYILLAAIYSEQDEHKDAIEVLHYAEKNTQISNELQYALAFEYRMIKKHNKAIDIYKSIINSDPDDNMTLTELILAYEEVGKINEAIKFLTEFIDENPLNLNTWIMLANAYNINAQHEKAIEAYEYALAIDSEFPPAIFGKGQSLLFAQNYQEAINCLNELKDDEMTSPIVFLSLAEAYFQLGNYSIAATNFAKSMEAMPDFVIPIMGLANSLMMLDLHEEALETINDAIRIEPNNSEAYYIKGEILCNSDRLEEAITALKKSIKIDKNNEQTWLLLSETNHLLNGIQSALEVIEKAEKTIDNENILILYRKVALLFEMGKNKKAINELINALSIDPKPYLSIYDYSPLLIKNEIIQEIVSQYLNE